MKATSTVINVHLSCRKYVCRLHVAGTALPPLPRLPPLPSTAMIARHDLFNPQVPVPSNTARCHIHVGLGRAKYEPEQRAIVWRIKRMIGGAETVFTADVELTPSIRGKAWSRPPIQVGWFMDWWISWIG